MGFSLNRTYELRWADGDLAGLEIDIRSMSMATMEIIRESEDHEVAAIVAEHIVRWNFDDVKPTTEGLMSLEHPVFREICAQWYRAARGISAPLDLGSSDGVPSPVASIPMETP